MAVGPSISTGARVQAVSENLAAWGRGLAVLVAALYAAGFLVVNAYLGSFGVRDFEPLRTRYVATGISFLLLAALSAVFAARALDFVLSLGKSRPRTHRLLFVGLGLPVAVFLITLLLIGALTSLRAPVPWVRVGDVAVFVFSAMLFAMVVRNRRDDWHTTTGTLIVLGTLTWFVGGLIAYANTIYPALPTWFGGGRPDVVELVVEDSATVCPLCGAGPVKLLDDDSSRIVILIQAPDGTERAVEIARGAVRSITHSPAVPRP